MSDRICLECDGTGQRLTERFSKRLGYVVSAVGPCGCQRGVELEAARIARSALPNPNVAPAVSAAAATIAVESLASIPFFPGESAARLIIAKEIQRICHSDADSLWLVDRMVRLFGDRWPGPAELRRVYCARRRPLDGIEAEGSSERYPDGIPSEKPKEPALLGAAAGPKALPAGAVASGAQTVERAVLALAEAKNMNRTGPAPRIPGIPLMRDVPAGQKITQADVDRAVEELHERRAKEEL
jgi:hypothetical protein